jgi:hypothetical protein
MVASFNNIPLQGQACIWGLTIFVKLFYANKKIRITGINGIRYGTGLYGHE